MKLVLNLKDSEIMIQSLTTWRELKRFAESLTESQLDEKLFFGATEQPVRTIDEVEILECDYINPSGETIEPITDYLPGGQYYEDDFDAEDEAVVFSKGTIFLVNNE